MRHTFRYIVDAPVPGAEVALSESDAHHLTRVVRRAPGDEVEMIDGDGNLWPATVVRVGEAAAVRLGDAPRAAPAPLPITLAIGLAEWGRLDLVVEKATELGVPAVRVFVSERARRVPDDRAFAARRARMLRVAESAARQAGHGRLPAVDGVVPFADVLADATAGAGAGFLVDPRATEGLGAAVDASGAEAATLIVGPDAGFTPGEVAQARQAGIAVARLGDATLRTETAAIVAVAVAADALGRLGG